MSHKPPQTSCGHARKQTVHLTFGYQTHRATAKVELGGSRPGFYAIEDAVSLLYSMLAHQSAWPEDDIYTQLEADRPDDPDQILGMSINKPDGEDRLKLMLISAETIRAEPAQSIIKP